MGYKKVKQSADAVGGWVNKGGRVGVQAFETGANYNLDEVVERS